MIAFTEFDRLYNEHAHEVDDYVRPTLVVNGRLKNAIARTVWNPALGEVEIQISRWATEHLTDEELLDTVRHEWAHVLAGRLAGHGRRWRLYARLLGATPSAATEVSSAPTPAWALVCRSCSEVLARRHRRSSTKFSHAGPCGGSAEFVASGSRLAHSGHL